MSTQTFLSLKIERDLQEEDWFQALRSALAKQHVPYDCWQGKGTYHQTILFINDTPSLDTIKEEAPKVLHNHKSFKLTLDKLDAFTADDKHIVNLTSTQQCPEMDNLVEDLRNMATQKGIPHDKRKFKLHITLGRIPTTGISLDKLQSILSTINLPSFTPTMSKVEYRYAKKLPRGVRDYSINQWTLPPADQP